MPAHRYENEQPAVKSPRAPTFDKKYYDQLCQGDAFKQDAFSQTEISLQLYSTLILGTLTFIFTGFHLGLLEYLIPSTSGSLQALQMGFVYLWSWIGCLLMIVALKYAIYYVVGFLYGMRPLTAYEDFWLYDLPVNPYGIPSILIFNKTDKDPTEMYESILQKTRYDTHCDLKMVKMLGKYFFKPLDEEEYQTWKRTHTGILTDVNTDEEIIDFMLKLKALPCKSFTENVVRFYYLPSINNGTESAIMTYGHHCMQDGLSAMQAFHRTSDAPETSEYPFIRKPAPSFFHWLMVYLTIPFGMFKMYTWYKKEKNDVNCIKKHEKYMLGKPNAAKSLEISVAKTKQLSKQYGVTINDLILAVITKVLKKHFDSKGDKSEQITMAMPFTFQVIPDDPNKYVFYNYFTSLTLYVKLTDNFNEALQNAKKQMNFIKSSIIPYALMVIVQMYNTIFPQQHAINVNYNGGKKHSLVYSNIPGYVKPVFYGGQVVKRFFYLASAAGSLSTAITMVSMLKRLSITLTSDEFNMNKDDVKKFIEMVNKELKEMDILYDENVEGKD